MSTRCRIGIEQPDGKIKSIYCHHDGYYEGVGTVLQKYYDTPEKINELMKLGDISGLGKRYDQEMSELDWRRSDEKLTPEQKKKLEQIRGFSYTVAYKDHGENVPARVDKDLQTWKGSLGDCWEDYAYLFMKDGNGNYHWTATEIGCFVPLEWKIKALD